MNFLRNGWITKIGGLLTLAGGMLTASGDITYGPAIVGIGGLITGFASRQANETSEDLGIITPEVVVQVTPVVKVVEQPPVLTAREKRALRE